VSRGKGKALIPTGLRLEAEILERLRGSGRGLSDEIRERLERTFKEDAIDPAMRELRDALPRIAEALHREYGAEWHEWPQAHAAFVAAALARLAGYAPPVRQPETAVEVLSNPLLAPPTDSPEVIGRTHERADRRIHAQLYPHLAAALARWSRTFTARVGRYAKAKGEGQ
jgi:hypothetical protein